MPTNTFGQSVSQASGSVVPTAPPSQVGNNDGPSTTTAPTIPVAPSATASPVTVPPAPTPTSPLATNASIPTPEQIAADTTTPTPTAQAQTGILGKIAQLVGGQSSLATQQYNQEQTANVLPGQALSKAVNDLSVQLQGLNDQATNLSTQASQGGALQNSYINSVQSGNADVYRAHTDFEQQLRQNQVQQASIASQALTVKSALYAAQGQYTLAKDAADKAAQVQFDYQTQQINYQKALLDQLAPQLSKEQATQAAVLQAKLNDRSTQIQQQVQNKKDVTAQAIQAMTNNPNDPAAQFAAQQALKLDPTDPNYTAKAAQLLGKYQANPLDTQLKQAQIQNARIDTALKSQQLDQLNQAPDLSQLPANQQAQLKSSGFMNYNSQVQSLAQQVVNGDIAPSELSKRATGTAPYNTILQAANVYSQATTGKPFSLAISQRQYDFANNTGTQNTLTYLTSLVGGPNNPGNLDTLLQTTKTIQAAPNTVGSAGQSIAGGASSFPALNDAAQWAKIQAGNSQYPGYYAQLLEVSDQIAKILQGGGTGSGTSDAKLSQAQGLFNKGFTANQVEGVINSIKPLLANRGKEIVAGNPYLSDYATRLGYGAGQTGTLPDGTSVTRGADGSITDAQGNKYDENGNKIK